MSQAANFVPGGYGVPAGYNFVSTADLVQRHVDPKLVQRYGSQLLNMLSNLGYKKPVDNALIYEHYEANRIMPKITASVSSTSGGALATFTLTSTSPVQQFAQSQYSPYVATSPATYVAGIPVRLNDVIQMFASTGVSSGANAVQAIVVGVNAIAGTFTAYSVNNATIPTLTDAEITIVGKAFGEGSVNSTPLATLSQKYTNTLQTLKEAFEITGTLNKILLYPESKTFEIKGEEDAYARMENYRELSLLLGQSISNTNIANQFKTTPVVTTTGLIPTILANGVVQGYSPSLGFGVNELMALTTQLDTQKGSEENLMKVGLNLSMIIDTNLGDYFKNGAISYGFFGGKEKAVDFQFKSMNMGNYTFHKGRINAFTDLQTLGAANAPYRYEGMVMPAEGMNDSMSGDAISAIRVRFQPGREMLTTYRDLREVSDDGRDVIRVDYLATVGLEVMGANSFAYIKQQ